MFLCFSWKLGDSFTVSQVEDWCDFGKLLLPPGLHNKAYIFAFMYLFQVYFCKTFRDPIWDVTLTHYR